MQILPTQHLSFDHYKVIYFYEHADKKNTHQADSDPFLFAVYEKISISKPLQIKSKLQFDFIVFFEAPY